MLKFYDIDENYIQFLKTIDRQVPDVKYDSNNKFLCGVVLEINGVKYYALSLIKQINNRQIYRYLTMVFLYQLLGSHL